MLSQDGPGCKLRTLGSTGIPPQVFRHVVPSIVSYTAHCGLEGVWGTSTCSAGLIQNFLETLVYVCVVSRQFVGYLFAIAGYMSVFMTVLDSNI